MTSIVVKSITSVWGWKAGHDLLDTAVKTRAGERVNFNGKSTRGFPLRGRGLGGKMTGRQLEETALGN